MEKRTTLLMYFHFDLRARHQQEELERRRDEPLRTIAHAEEEAGDDGTHVAVLHDRVDDVDVTEAERRILEGRGEDLRESASGPTLSDDQNAPCRRSSSWQSCE